MAKNKVRPRLELNRTSLETLPIYAALNRGSRKLREQSTTITLSAEIDEKVSEGVIRMSQIGSCGRILWHAMHPSSWQPVPSVDIPVEGQRAYHMGSLIEEYVIALFRAGGYTVERQQETLSDFDGRVLGHIDGILRNSKEKTSLLEIKGLQHSTCEALTYSGGVKEVLPSYYDQMQYYLTILSGETPAISSGYFVAFDKDTSQFYIEHVEFDRDRSVFLQNKAFWVWKHEWVLDLSEIFLIRKCTFCPLHALCKDLDGEEKFQRLMLPS